MKVHDLQQFLRSLALPLTSAGGKKAADDLEKAAEGLNLFRDMSIPEFAGFLDKANHFVTTGELPLTGGRPRAGAKKAPENNAEELRQKTQRLMEMYEKALDPDFSYDAVKQEIKNLNSLKFDELKQIARDLNLAKSFRRKADVLDALERRITERRATHERNQFRPTSEEPAAPSPKPAADAAPV
jgi:hypothetical protein